MDRPPARAGARLLVCALLLALDGRAPAAAQDALRRLDRDAFLRLAAPALSEALSPCQVTSIRAPERVMAPAGALQIQAEGEVPTRSGRAHVAASVSLSRDGRTVRVPVRVRLVCPVPVVEPGGPVRIVAVVGPVRVSANGEARQSGRVGEVIHVVNVHTDAALRARVVDARTVEVVR